MLSIKGFGRANGLLKRLKCVSTLLVLYIAMEC